MWCCMRVVIKYNICAIVGGMSCIETSSTTSFSMSNFVHIMNDVQQHPEEGLSLCSSITQEDKHAECLLFAMEKIKISKKKYQEANSHDLFTNLCYAIPSHRSEHSECFFLLAEKTGAIEYCAQSTIFAVDCNSHILSRYLLEHNVTTFDQANAIAIKYRLPLEDSASLYASDIPTYQIARTIVYRHLLSLEKPIPIHLCAKFPHPDDCEKAGVSLYIDRLRYAMHQNTLPCSTQSDLSKEILGDLYHQNNDLLKNTFIELQEDYCNQHTFPH